MKKSPHSDSKCIEQTNHSKLNKKQSKEKYFSSKSFGMAISLYFGPYFVIQEDQNAESITNPFINF
jgi:hypothetical protein